MCAFVYILKSMSSSCALSKQNTILFFFFFNNIFFCDRKALTIKLSKNFIFLLINTLFAL